MYENPEVGSTFTAITAAGERLAQAMARESELHSLKGIRKSEAIVRLIGTENAETQKPHSASSAEKIVEADPTYAQFLAECRQSVIDRIRAETELTTAKLGGQLAVAHTAARLVQSVGA